MRKALLFLAIVVCGTAFARQAQSKVYCEIIGTSKMFSKKLTIEVDFGQESTLFSRETLVYENGKPIVFNSMVDAMNYMGTLGWEFEQAYVVTVESGSSATNVYHWLLSRYVSQGEDFSLTTRSQYRKDAKGQDTIPAE